MVLYQSTAKLVCCPFLLVRLPDFPAFDVGSAVCQLDTISERINPLIARESLFTPTQIVPQD